MRPVPVVLAVVALVAVSVVPAVGYERPDGVSCTYDESDLREYQPETYLGHLDVEPTASYGGVYSSANRDTDVYVYFLRYARQDGLTSVDSHVRDREPVYVMVDDETGAVERVVFSVYHYLKAVAEPSSLSMNGSHARLYVVNPWHQYLPWREHEFLPSVGDGTRVELKNYCEAVDRWHANGWLASEAATTNPWTMRDRDSWWADESIERAVWKRYGEVRGTLADAVPSVDAEAVPDGDADAVPDIDADLLPEDSGVLPDLGSGVVPDVASDLVPDLNSSFPSRTPGSLSESSADA